MEVITIESQAFSQLLTTIENLTRELRSQNQNSKTSSNQPKPKEKLSLGDEWLDNEDVCTVSIPLLGGVGVGFSHFSFLIT